MERAEFTIPIRREALSTGEDIYVALCLELDIASQGVSAEIERRLPFRTFTSKLFA